MSNVKDGYLYSKKHEWIKIESDEAVVGITDYAQAALGDITYVDLPQTNISVKEDDVVAGIESVKTASDIYIPVAGEIVEVNSELNNHPEIINSDPYEAGWIFKVKMISKTENLMNAEEYRDYLSKV